MENTSMDTKNLNKVNHKLEMDRFYTESSGYVKGFNKSSENLKKVITDNNLGYFNAFERDALNVGIINENELNTIIIYLDDTWWYHIDLENECREYDRLLGNIRDYIYNGQSTEKDLDEILEKINRLEEFELTPPEFTQELKVISSKLPEEGRYLLTKSQNQILATQHSIANLRKTIDELNDSIKEFNETGKYTGFNHISDLEQHGEVIIERRAYVHEQSKKLASGNLNHDDIVDVKANIDKANNDILNNIYMVSQKLDILDSNGVRVLHNSVGIPEYIDVTHDIMSDNLSITMAGFKVYDSTTILNMANYYTLEPILPITVY